jgi:hypothetical protein
MSLRAGGFSEMGASAKPGCATGARWAAVVPSKQDGNHEIVSIGAS